MGEAPREVTQVRYECKLPQAAARWLAGPHGPLASGRRGAINWDGNGTVTLDEGAFGSLKLLGVTTVQDGRIVYRGHVPCIAFDPLAYPVYPLPQPGAPQEVTKPHGG